MNTQVGLAGFGTIGQSWYKVFNRAGYEVLVFDPFADRIQFPDVQFVDSVKELQSCCYVQESLPEDVILKKNFFNEVDTAITRKTIVGSSSSAICISKIVDGLKSSERFLIAHPANPPHLLRLVELVPGPETSIQTIEAAHKLMSNLGQCPVTVTKEINGFILNRLQYALFRESIRLVLNGVASVEDIDLSITEGLGMRWSRLGPFATEATNGTSVVNNYEKFLPTIQELVEEVGEPIDVSSNDWQRIVKLTENAYGAGSTQHLSTIRDNWLEELAEIKQSSKINIKSQN